MDTTVHDPLLGRMLDGRYRVEHRIAAGGMATVYRAMDTRLDRVVALKVMHAGLAADPDFTARFIREAKAVARLSHPNVVNVFDQGSDQGVVFLSMEYVPGWTLRDLLRDRGALSPRTALDILEPVLAALGAAHRAGLVHRDVKPENVLLTEDGRVKVADFGLARAMTGESSVTTGQVMGTVAYLSPEQIQQGDTDPRTDVYACGVMLFEMLTGSKPHTGDSPMQVIYQHLSTDVPPPSTLAPGVPPELDAIAVAATSREAARRPPDAVALLAVLQQVRRVLAPAQLDAEPPSTADATLHLRLAAPAAERTSVLPPVAAAGQMNHAQLNHTSVMPGLHELPPDLIMPRREEPERFDPPASRRAAPGGRSRRRPRWMLPLGVVVLLGLVAGAATWVLNGALYLTLPSLAGQAQSAAAQTLRADGLTVSVSQQFSPNVPVGQVIASEPVSGTRVRKDSSVVLDVSKGPNRPAVPNVAGKSLAAAKQAITGAGLVVGQVTQQPSGVPAGDVISTDPAAGTKEQPNTVVDLVVSNGVPPASLPNVVGEPVAQAMADLRAAGFAAQVNPVYVNSGVAAGSVVSQSPSGTSAPAGSPVSLTVSDGPVQVTVPDVTGDDEAQARAALTAAGFAVKVHKFMPFGDPTVATEDPSGGAQAAQGSTVTITLF
ncbi:Stk1 family PASTA domain-containing Ser/Thr kinase [Streptacidiphilus sp. P02-A3a]|uniref:Stk1 family PASTA domain-containing Ser/Thr kinase n=1 Tax=Streptacidiphilus sp. P02-A3a TaxID=2704468 RepID=UPI0015F9516B|nr:Stk1 family PASTA domain-containing Ser/Thr kinase [Streptacidiphilus sp. P02-A3a]QMU68545.1 Stk1 family PASTA domain-containing Ser/Thr kinase [Streptacidiphilus sp. P02-A3a]